MRKNMWMYQWGIICNFGAFMWTCVIDGQKKGFFDGFSWTVWVLIILNAGMGFSVSFLLKYFDTIIKGFASCL